MWLKHTATQFGWPPAYISLVAEVPAGASQATPSALLGRLAHDGAATGARLAAMVVACASHIGEESVTQWAARGSLFTSSQPQGLIPGEGAVGLLLTDLRLAQSIEGLTFALLDPVGEARRDASADDIRRPAPQLLGELVERALKHSAAALSDVAMIVADTGHRSSRVLELMGLAAGAMPQLDGEADVVRAGVATGACGAVPFMTALALARHHALERAAPVLCIGNEDPYHCCAALIRPATAPP
jgi:3-oxoacyl-(acyl-carrier-protein) synthase